jgi:plasmid stabilization system protein ParE
MRLSPRSFVGSGWREASSSLDPGRAGLSRRGIAVHGGRFAIRSCKGSGRRAWRGGVLSFFSERGRVVPEIGSRAVREIFVYRFRVMYQVSAHEVRILAVFHGAMDFDRWLRHT